jgi:hypothetical protein
MKSLPRGRTFDRLAHDVLDSSAHSSLEIRGARGDVRVHLREKRRRGDGVEEGTQRGAHLGRGEARQFRRGFRRGSRQHCVGTATRDALCRQLLELARRIEDHHASAARAASRFCDPRKVVCHANEEPGEDLKGLAAFRSALDNVRLGVEVTAAVQRLEVLDKLVLVC